MAKVIYDNPIASEECETCIPWVRVTRSANYEACLRQAHRIGPVDSASKVYRLLRKPLSKEDQEVFIAILLDRRLQLRGVSEIHRGARDRVEVSVADVLRVALTIGATGLVVVHNHPSGVADPSDADRALTKDIKVGCDQVDITFIDHLVIGVDEYYSFADGRATRARGGNHGRRQDDDPKPRKRHR